MGMGPIISFFVIPPPWYALDPCIACCRQYLQLIDHTLVAADSTLVSKPPPPGSMATVKAHQPEYAKNGKALLVLLECLGMSLEQWMNNIHTQYRTYSGCST